METELEPFIDGSGRVRRVQEARKDVGVRVRPGTCTRWTGGGTNVSVLEASCQGGGTARDRAGSIVRTTWSLETREGQTEGLAGGTLWRVRLSPKASSNVQFLEMRGEGCPSRQKSYERPHDQDTPANRPRGRGSPYGASVPTAECSDAPG